jgi:DNA-binding NarL/FixJ family response regulator
MVSILIADDHAPWRRYVSALLQKTSCYNVISEVADGLEAVLCSEELQPDLILLDLGLPNINGMEAMRRIRLAGCRSVIMAVTNEASPDIVEEVLKLGAKGYILKTDGNELLTAIETVLKGEQFLSSHVSESLVSARRQKSLR